MDRSSASKIDDSNVPQPSVLSPHPTSTNGIHNRHHEGERNVRDVAKALGNSTRHNRRRGHREGHLEEVHGEELHAEWITRACVDEKVAKTEKWIRKLPATIHERESKYPKADATSANVHHVPHQHVHLVLSRNYARFKQR